MDTHLIALNPGDMVSAQQSLVQFCGNKIAQARGELAETERIIEALLKNNMEVRPALRLKKVAQLKIAFYEKIAKALDAGYYIIPPMACQSFAVRSKNALPPPKYASYDQSTVEGQTLPVGVGDFHSAVADRGYSHTDTRAASGDKPERRVDIYKNHGWRDIEFPFALAKPEIIEATGKAIRERIFDVLAVAPEYRAADPMIIGQIKHWKRNGGPIHFFVAWWLDTDTL